MIMIKQQAQKVKHMKQGSDFHILRHLMKISQPANTECRVPHCEKYRPANALFSILVIFTLGRRVFRLVEI